MDVLDKKKDKLNHYMRVEYLWPLLKNKQLSFRTPEKWDDKNDVEVLELYRQKKNVNSIYAICFLNEEETIHHWTAFANSGNSTPGCCIEFKKMELISHLRKIKGMRHRKVSYKTRPKVADGIKSGKILVRDMPFIKRWPYRYEKEYRFIWEGTCSSMDSYEVDIDLSLIRKITISPNVTPDKHKEIKAKIKRIAAGVEIEVNHSKVQRLDGWIDKFRNVRKAMEV